MEQPQQRLTRQTKENLSSSASSRALDASTRARRTQKFLESLEQDNFHEDPSEPSSFESTLTQEEIAKKLNNTSAFGYSRQSKGLILESDEPTSTTTTNANKRRKVQFKHDVFKTRFRKNLQTLLDEELGPNGEKSTEKNYFSIAAKPSKYPALKLCAVCGITSHYTCQICGSLYCSLKCLDIHKDTRCLKFTA